MTSRDKEMAAFAERVRDIMGRGIPEEIAEVLDAEATVWECTDSVSIPMSAVGAFHAALAEALESMDFLDSSVVSTSNGYIDRHTKRMTTKGGQQFLIPSCLIIELRDGKIHRVAEYLDSARFPPEVQGLRAVIIGKLGIGEA
jgi:ketosteroid isomerase-like protein